MLRKLLRSKKGQGLVEYALIVAGVALIAAASISVFGHKVSDMIAATAAVLPGAHADDNGPIQSGKLIETTNQGSNGGIALDTDAISEGGSRLGENVGLSSADDFGGLVLEAESDTP